MIFKRRTRRISRFLTFRFRLNILGEKMLGLNHTDGIFHGRERKGLLDVFSMIQEVEAVFLGITNFARILENIIIKIKRNF